MATLAPISETSAASHREAFAALKAGLKAAGAAAPPRLSLDALIPSAIPALDRILGGGFPRGALVTLEGTAGRWSIAARLVAQVTGRALAAIVDDGSLYPPDLARAGARLDRVLIAPARTPLAVARAVDIVVRSRACRLVLMTAPPDLRAAVWNRLAGLAHRTGVLLIAIAVRAAAPLAAAAALRLDCTLDRLIVHGTRGLWCAFAGYDVRTHVRKHKQLTAAATAAVAATPQSHQSDARVRAVNNAADDGATTLRERVIAVPAEEPRNHQRERRRYAALR
jgi:hypothetical protein